MGKLLIVYGTTDGHTREIAEAVADAVGGFGHAPHVVEAAACPRVATTGVWDGVIVCAPIRAGKHPPAVVRFVRDNLAALNHLPTAFFSASLSAVNDPPAARKCVDQLLAQTGWHPSTVRLVAGALLYTRYNWVVRWMMRRIARKNGGDTDTTRDHDYTDWQRLREDVEEFLLGAVPTVRTGDRPLAAV